MKKVAFHNLGCKVNSYEMEYVQQQFKESGYEIVQFGQKADIYVINTCTVTNIADRKSRQMLHKARKINPDAIVCALGCYVQTDTDGAKEDPAIDILIGNNRKADTLRIIEEYMGSRDSDGTDKGIGSVYVPDMKEKLPYEDMILRGSMEHTRVSVKIQDGCDQYCSYCAIPYSRGHIRSRDKKNIIEEITNLANAGYMEVVLTGIHLSSYGLDFDGREGNYNRAADKGEYTNMDLLDVIKAVSGISGINRIRLGSLEPRIITRDFLGGLKNIKEFCPHFHLSLQSGSNTVLKRMNRHYTAEEFLERISLIREYFPNAAIMTDVIVGFPGETEEEFNECREFLKKANLYRAHVFKYSKREGTTAASMKGQVADKIKDTRSEILIKDSAERERDFAAAHVGKEVKLLLEDEETVNGISYRMGYTDNYVRCAVRADKCPACGLISGVGAGLLTDEILEVYADK